MSAEFDRPEDAVDALRGVLAAGVEPVVAEIVRDHASSGSPTVLAVSWSGFREDTEWMSRRAVEAQSDRLLLDEEKVRRLHLSLRQREESIPGGYAVFQAGFSPSDAALVIRMIGLELPEAGYTVRPLSGTARITVRAGGGEDISGVRSLQEGLLRQGGLLVPVAGPAWVRREFPPWSLSPQQAGLLGRIKSVVDPKCVLQPGRFL
jgi:hypothetical protein